MGGFTLVTMAKRDREARGPDEDLSEKVKRLEVEIEAHEALLKMALDDMRRIYEDLLRSQSQLMQSDKLSTIGLLTAGIVHEINNPLSAVKLAFSVTGSQLEALKKHLEEKSGASDGEGQKLMQQLEEFTKQGRQCAEHIARIVTDIRTFSKSDKGISNPENINAVIDSTINVVWSAVKNKVKIEKKYGELPPVKCNKQQLSQVFLNLLVNASQAMDSSGAITITTSSGGGNARIDIADTGCGMPQEVLDRLFEPFFTTKGEEGTGLGLGITRDIIKKHGGDITVKSQVGKGTTFTIVLPLSA